MDNEVIEGLKLGTCLAWPQKNNILEILGERLDKKIKLTRRNRKTGNVWSALCEECDEGFIIKAGSVISDVEFKGLTERMRTIRARAKIDPNRVLLEDVVVKDLRDAAAFVLATNANVTYWNEIISD